MYLVVSALVGGTLLAVAAPDGGTDTTSASPPSYRSAGDDADGAGRLPDDSPGPADQAPHGFHPVSGPAGVRTVIPDGWQVAEPEPEEPPADPKQDAPPDAFADAGINYAVDPDDTRRFVGYGGARFTSPDLEQTHISYERRFAARTTDYERVTMVTATYAGHTAVEWEYRHHDGSGLRHVRSLYWRVGTIEYVIFAASAADGADRMRHVYDAMVSNSRP